MLICRHFRFSKDRRESLFSSPHTCWFLVLFVKDPTLHLWDQIQICPTFQTPSPHPLLLKTFTSHLLKSHSPLCLPLLLLETVCGSYYLLPWFFRYSGNLIPSKPNPRKRRGDAMWSCLSFQRTSFLLSWICLLLLFFYYYYYFHYINFPPDLNFFPYYDVEFGLLLFFQGTNVHR